LEWERGRYTPSEAKDIEARAEKEREHRNRSREHQRALEEKEAEKEAEERKEVEREEAIKESLKSAYGERNYAIASSAGIIQAIPSFFGMLLVAGCLLSFTVAWLLGFVGWSPKWWIQMHSFEVIGLIAIPLAQFVLFIEACGGEAVSVSRLDPKGRSGAFDLFLIRIDLVVGWIQIACWLFFLAFTLLGFFGYAPEWWTTLSKVNYYGLLLGPMAISIIYLAITGSIAAYVRRSNSKPSNGVNADEAKILKWIKQCRKDRFYIRRDKTIKGPFTAGQIVDFAQKKRLKSMDEVGTSEKSNFILLTKVYSRIKKMANQ
jgi:hypothetical protein